MVGRSRALSNLSISILFCSAWFSAFTIILFKFCSVPENAGIVRA